MSKSALPGTAQIKGGAIQGLNVGTQFAFYLPGKGPGNGSPIDSGAVVKSNGFYCTVQLSKPETKFTERQVIAYVTQQSYGDGVIKVYVDNRSKQAERIKDKLKDNLIEFTDDKSAAQLQLDQSGTSGGWALFVGNTDLTFATELATNTDSDFEKILTKIREYNQYQFLQQLNSRTTNLNARLEIIPLSGGKPDTTLLKTKLNASGILELEVGDQVVFKITNTDKATAYINIIDLQPDGIINPLLPCESSCDGWIVSPAEMMIKAGESLLLADKVIAIGEPYGTEILKVFVTREPLNLEYIRSTRGLANSKGVTSSLDMFFKRSYTLTRGTTVSIDPDGTVFSVPFKIVPKKL